MNVGEGTNYQLAFPWQSPGEMVEEFAVTAKQRPNPKGSATLIEEEFYEWLDSESPEEELKELADLLYVIYGYVRVRGWDLDEAVRRVHNNNMGRMFQPDGSIKFREDGKVMKNKEYPKVNLEDLV